MRDTKMDNTQITLNEEAGEHIRSTSNHLSEPLARINRGEFV